MKKKKGFTLVELLAVVAILSLLVIIALPNIMEMFKDAKKNSFLTECKQIYKTAQQEWMKDSMFETDEQIYSRCKTCTGKTLSLSGRTELDYNIGLNKAGKVIFFEATDGTYQYSYNGDDLKIEDITFVQEISTLPDDQKITITSPLNGEIYIAYDGQMQIGNPIPEGVTYYKSYAELQSVSSRPIFLKHVIKNDIVRESYIGYNINGNVYYVRGGITGADINSRKSIMDSIFSSCFLNMQEDNYHCETDKIKGTLFGSGFGAVSGYDTSSGCYVGCTINSNGVSKCDSERVFC